MKLQTNFAVLLMVGWASCAAGAGENAAPCAQGDLAGGRPRLHITALGARRATGNITYTLYGENPALFLKPRGSIALTRVMLTGTSAEACFVVGAPGIYAVAIYHDENDNHHFDKNFLGLPVEGFGFSNDAPISFGPPGFAATRIVVHPGENRIHVTLRY